MQFKMKLLLMSCLVLLLTVCIVEETEGYNMGKANCNGNCYVLQDLCSGAGTVPDHVCDNAFSNCLNGCK
ncbi:hypothetical protein ACROYT_G020448 [Oculina patagonica]